MMAEPNKDMSIDRKSVGKRLTTTEYGMYKLAFQYNFITLYF